MIHIIKYLQCIVKITKAFKEFCSLLGKQRLTQEILTSSFSFCIKKAELVSSIPEIVAKFMFIQVAKIKSLPA